ncbi:RbsD/FucU family protein [Bifidobacterium longum]|uniref:L-fucose mutarotase n=1 Tax=Bifidobacterium longum subsp. infantis TaxID=1682 RepID=A0A8U0KS85_BIFLI|nr:RbsD/FucU domain-containing protein [Bifidobacterium longum]MDW3109187.1 RbsD/FucU domain-containing protein [Bifidobacterium longum]VWQ27318.1 L-fucose mutarotase [Bifidobacterium longum subsp. infantis]VWQ31680.1 L-fucose mutarotase [Bifidobacterium longum subsp. infantis]VWQ38004.1 L-fucose mutarotase [Bifidobacterium longum subsp. infantis]
MLKGIPPIIQPDLLKILSEMGHGDAIVLADAHFPAEPVGVRSHVIRYDGQPIEPLLDAVLQLIPLDQYTEHPVLLMDKVPGDTVDTPIWDRYRQVIDRHEPGRQAGIGMLERFAFYEEAGRSYCIVATGEQSQYANIIIRKGVIR